MLELVNARRYTIAELNNLLYRVLDSNEPVTVPSGVQVRRGNAEEAGPLSGLVSRSFFEKGDVPEGFADMLAPAFPFSLSSHLCRFGGQSSRGCGRRAYHPGAPYVCPVRGGHAAQFRGRGIQTTLLGTRLKAAAEAGCELAVVVTRGGTISERNCVRLGFRIAYSKATVIKHWDQS